MTQRGRGRRQVSRLRARRENNQASANGSSTQHDGPLSERKHLHGESRVEGNAGNDSRLQGEAPITDCAHITLVKQTGPMDGDLKSKRYVCQQCGDSFKAEVATIEVREGEPMTKEPARTRKG